MSAAAASARALPRKGPKPAPSAVWENLREDVPAAWNLMPRFVTANMGPFLTHLAYLALEHLIAEAINGAEARVRISDEELADLLRSQAEAVRLALGEIGGPKSKRPGPGEIRLIEWEQCGSGDRRRKEYRLCTENWVAWARKAEAEWKSEQLAKVEDEKAENQSDDSRIPQLELGHSGPLVVMPGTPGVPVLLSIGIGKSKFQGNLNFRSEGAGETVIVPSVEGSDINVLIRHREQPAKPARTDEIRISLNRMLHKELGLITDERVRAIETALGPASVGELVSKVNARMSMFNPINPKRSWAGVIRLAEECASAKAQLEASERRLGAVVDEPPPAKPKCSICNGTGVQGMPPEREDLQSVRRVLKSGAGEICNCAVGQVWAELLKDD